MSLAAVEVSAKSLIGLSGGGQIGKNSTVTEQYSDSSILNANFYYAVVRSRRSFYLGIEYAAITLNQYVAESTKATVINNSPYVGMRATFFDQELMSYTFALNPAAVANYKVTGYSNESWKGTAYLNKLSIQPDVGLDLPNLKVGVSMTYYYGKFTNENSLITSKMSFTQTLFLPSLDLVYKF